MPAVRSCRVTITDPQGASHAVDVQATTLFEAAAAALAAFRQQGWATDALTPRAILRVEVRLPPIVYDVPIQAVERWLQSSSSSPREMIRKKVAAPGARPR